MAKNIDFSQLPHQNVFVFNIPVEWSEEELRKQFESFGTILSARVEKRANGFSKGYGFVCFDSPEAAQKSVEEMSGKVIKKKKLQVSIKKSTDDSFDTQIHKLMSTTENDGIQNSTSSTFCLFVFHIPSFWTDKDLYEKFGTFGNLISAKISKKLDNSSKGYGFVTFSDSTSAALAISTMNKAKVENGKRLKVMLKTENLAWPPLQGGTVFVFHIPNEWSNEDLRLHFNNYGKIIESKIQKEANGKTKGYGFVTYSKAEDALSAIASMNGFNYGNKFLKVSLKRDDEPNTFNNYPPTTRRKDFSATPSMLSLNCPNPAPLINLSSSYSSHQGHGIIPNDTYYSTDPLFLQYPMPHLLVGHIRLYNPAGEKNELYHDPMSHQYQLCRGFRTPQAKTSITKPHCYYPNNYRFR